MWPINSSSRPHPSKNMQSGKKPDGNISRSSWNILVSVVAKASDKKELVAWLGARALEHDRPTLLLQQACERLYQLRLVRPAITTMEDLVADARRWAEQKTVEVLVDSLPKRVQKTLDTLLINDETRGISPVTWLRRYATGHSDKNILETLEKLAFIRQWDVASWQTDELPPMRIQHLAQIARYTSTRSLKRKKPDGKTACYPGRLLDLGP